MSEGKVAILSVNGENLLCKKYRLNMRRLAVYQSITLSRATEIKYAHGP